MKGFLYFALIFFLVSCGGPEPRKPIKSNSGSFIKESVERNKRLLAAEEALFQELIAKDSANNYLSTDFGGYYYYQSKKDSLGYTPKEDDLVKLTYNIRTLANDTIYSMEDIGILNYKVDKQELFPGLRAGVKILKEEEMATFLLPSSQSYGYHGDNKKIGPNTPIITTVKILQITKAEDITTKQN